MDRRSFVRAVACLSLGPALRDLAHGADAASQPQPRLKVGFLGAAYSHAAPKLALLRNHPDFELVGVWDDDAKIREQVAGQGIEVLSQDEVLARSEVIAVESAVRDHARHARIALTAGRHVHLEKPPSLSLDDFKSVVELAHAKASRSASRVSVPSQPGVQCGDRCCARRAGLGDVYRVRATMNNQLAVERRAEWGQYKGGVMFELGSHMVDAVVRLLGKPDRVTPFLYTHGAHWRFTQRQHARRVGVSAGHRHRSPARHSSLPRAPTARWKCWEPAGTATIRPIEPPTLDMDLAHAAGHYKAGAEQERVAHLGAFRRGFRGTGRCRAR